MVLVSTSCWAELFNVPTFFACALSFWILANTALLSEVNACPRTLVHAIWSAIFATTSGKSVNATKLASNPALTAASWSAVPFNVGLAFSHVLSSVIFAASVALISICASRESG